MKRISEKFFLLILMVGAFVSCATIKGQVKVMSGDELVKQNSGREKDNVLIIDVRPMSNYTAGHIPHAINIVSDDIAKHLGRLSDWKEKPVIVYCNTGPRSTVAAEILADNGFMQVFNAIGVKQFSYELVTYTDILADTLLKMSTSDDVVLVDYRPTEMYKAGHIKGAINIPLGELNAHLNKLPRDKKIVFYCNTGTQSAKAAKELSELGYTKVYNSIIGVKEFSYNLVK